jgi:ABC-type branched-subunit amino acid transport system substrate-binding protein
VTARLRIGACLSLSGRFAQFGQQAAAGLKTWATLDGRADLVIEDDRSDKDTLRSCMPSVAGRSDLLLGPYSTILMRAAGNMAAAQDWLIWNHGGSGDDVEEAHPGHVVSVLTPTSRYAEPFLRRIAGDPARELVITSGSGSFGRQVTSGAEKIARQLGIRAVRVNADDQLPPPDVPREWDLFSAGVFEQDAELVSKAQRLAVPPRRICAVAAGVREFGRVADDPEGVFGIAQWFPGSGTTAALGPGEDEFIRAYSAANGTLPDYPALQATAGAVLAVHCAGLAGSTTREALWAAAASLDTSTLFGAFGINPRSGVQEEHQTVLVRWAGGKPVPCPPDTSTSSSMSRIPAPSSGSPASG